MAQRDVEQKWDADSIQEVAHVARRRAAHEEERQAETIGVTPGHRSRLPGRGRRRCRGIWRTSARENDAVRDGSILTPRTSISTARGGARFCRRQGLRVRGNFCRTSSDASGTSGTSARAGEIRLERECARAPLPHPASQAESARFVRLDCLARERFVALVWRDTADRSVELDRERQHDGRVTARQVRVGGAQLRKRFGRYDLAFRSRGGRWPLRGRSARNEGPTRAPPITSTTHERGRDLPTFSAPGS